jgi:tetratricopeptide (TPR) repeat protein
VGLGHWRYAFAEGLNAEVYIEMPDSIQPDLEGTIDLYARGELSPADARALAQEALSRPDLFEELNAVALAKAASEINDDVLQHYVSGHLSSLEEWKLAQEALNNEQLFDALATHGTVEKGLEDAAFRDAVLKRPKSRVRIYAMVGTIAAAIAFFAIYLRSPATVPNHNAATTSAKHVSLSPTLDASASGGQPILLASQLRPQSAATPIFRGTDSESRPPQQRGSVLSIDDQLPTVNLGSLDGLAKGSELQVFRDGQPVGRVLVNTVFRDRARGRIVAGNIIHVGDQVRTNDSVYLSAVLQQMDALTARGDLKKALDVGRKALASSVKNAKLLARVAAVEYQEGAVDMAVQHYEAAATEDPEALNSLAALYLLHGDYQRAEDRLKPDTAESLNNLGVAAELRGDSQKAAHYYNEALRAPGATKESQTSIQANLARVQGVK